MLVKEDSPFGSEKKGVKNKAVSPKRDPAENCGISEKRILMMMDRREGHCVINRANRGIVKRSGR